MKNLKINPVNNTSSDRNRYCGPAIISSLTGMTTGEAARLIRSVTGERKVTGVHTHHIIRALDLCGISFLQSKRFPNKPTLAKWLKDAKESRSTGRVFLVVAGHHFQLVEGRRYVCGRTEDIVSIKDKSVKRRCRVEEVYELKAEGKITIPDRARKPKRPSDPYRPFVQKMKKKYGFIVEYQRWNDLYWVEMPLHAEKLAGDTDHRLKDEHGCDGMQEVAGRMEDMAEFMEEHCVK